MDMSNELADTPREPKSTAEKIQHIKGLVDAQNEIQRDETSHIEPGGDDEKPVPGGADSRSGELGESESNAAESVEDAQQASEAGSIGGDEDAVTLGALAEHLGLEPSDVYELEVPIGDGQTTTLGQLKDEFKEYGPAKQYQAKLTEERESFERAQLQTRAELNAIINAIPEQIRAQVINAGRAHQAQWSKDEEKAVLEAIPDWSDADNRAKDRAMIIEDGAEYGFSEQEITFTQDSRTLRMLRDFARMKRELSGMRAAAKQEPGKASPPGRAASTTTSKRKLKQAITRAKADPTIQGKASVVSALIRGQ